jgi:osmotically-inducible protein OsmY
MSEGAKDAADATRQAANDVKNATRNAADQASNKVADAVITTSVHAELAKDPALSAVHINVDTDAGRVALKGTAPDAAAKERATQLASAVKGVVSVDNQLTVGNG